MQEKKSEMVIVSKKDRYAVITLNRPEKANALSPELMKELSEALQDVAVDENVGAVILTGAGRSFSAGGDFKMDIEVLGEMSTSEFDDFFKQVNEMHVGIIDMEKPVIAAVNGYAIAGGMELALACDIRIAAEDAHFGALFVRMGLCPEIGLYLLPRLVGLGKAKLISFTGDLLSAREAEQMGLVDIVVPPDRLMSTAEELAGRLGNGPRAIGLIKKAINECLTMDIRSAMSYARRLTYQLAHTEDHQEAVTAYLEKRAPVFKGR